MPIVSFEGQQHAFPDDFTEKDIAAALSSMPPRAPSADTPVRDLKPESIEDLHRVFQQTGAQMRQDGSMPEPAGMAKAAAIGVPKAVLGLADLPRLIENGLNEGNDRLVQWGMAWPRDRTPMVPMPPSSKELQAKLEGVTGPWYEPQNAGERVAETMGGFALGAAGRLPGLAERTVTQVLAPYIASESLGHATQGTALEPWARAVAPMLAGPMAGRIAARARPGPPTVDELKQSYANVVDDPAFRGTPLSTTQTTDLGVRMIDKLKAGGKDELNAPTPFQRAEQVVDFQNPTVGDVHAMRKLLRSDADSKITSNPNEAGASGMAKREVDNFLEQYAPGFKDANRDYAGAKAAEMLEGKRYTAEMRSSAANSGKNIDNATRQRVVDILTNERLRSKLTPEQIAEAEKIVKGTWIGEAARDVASSAGAGGGLSRIAAALGSAAVGGQALGAKGYALGALPLIAGPIAKSIENASTARGVRRLDELIRSQTPLGQARAAANPADPALLARVRLLLQGAAGLPRLEGSQ